MLEYSCACPGLEEKNDVQRSALACFGSNALKQAASVHPLLHWVPDRSGGAESVRRILGNGIRRHVHDLTVGRLAVAGVAEGDDLARAQGNGSLQRQDRRLEYIPQILHL